MTITEGDAEFHTPAEICAVLPGSGYLCNHPASC